MGRNARDRRRAPFRHRARQRRQHVGCDRGAGALAVGWIPVIGVAADVISLEEDYRDICALFATIDELSALLYLPESNLYRDNYCDVPAQGIELLKESARDTRFPWEQQPWEVQP